MTVQRLVVSVGCPSGIGPEVSVRAAVALAARANVVLVADIESLHDALEVAGLEAVPLTFVGSVADGMAHAQREREQGLEPVPQLRVFQPTAKLAPRDRVLAHPTAGGGVAQLAWIDAALDAVVRGDADAMVTGPVSKKRIVEGGASGFRGHTEHLAERLGVPHVTMAFASPQLTSALVTTHLPLRDVPQAITAAAVARSLLHLASYLAARPRAGGRVAKLALCGLNPHAGEGGLLGDEEGRIAEGRNLAQARLQQRGIACEISAPLPAESAFRLAQRGEFDGVLAMYHDQATIPMKLLGFGDAVNVTLGLPIVRTSVDHGTAYDQAGHGSADHRGMVHAMELACELSAQGGWPFRTS